MKTYLRRVEKKDVDLLFEWANDAVVRQNAFNTEPIPYENHVGWFNKMLENEAVKMYILCDTSSAPLGQIRLNAEGDRAYIDYSIAPEMRGRGLGTVMLGLVQEKFSHFEEKNSHIWSDIKKLVGQVKYENPASAKVFEKCGFARQDKEQYIEYIINV